MISSPALGGTHVLVVEDDESIRATLAELLVDEGAEVATAVHGRDALHTLRSATALPDLILLDLMMPVMDGWEFRIEQRNDVALAGIPLIAMSADMSAKARAIAADAYVRKPIDFGGLIGRIRSLVDLAAKQRHAVGSRMAALGTLTAGIAHQINNPLTYVMSNLQELSERLPLAGLAPEASDLGDLVAEALEGAERISRIVRQAQRVMPTQYDREPVPVDLRAILTGVLDRMKSQARGRAKLLWRLGPRVWVRGDRLTLNELFVDLVSNAIQAVPPGNEADNHIRVTMTLLETNRVAIEVADTGAGIPPDIQERIFQPFFTTRPVGQGVGLGLPVCRGIATALGGDISFESEPGRGTTFRVVLPTTAGPAASGQPLV